MRFYEPDITATSVGSTYTLNPENSHHLSHVLRAKIEDEVTVFNGKSGEFKATISTIDKKSVSLKVISFSTINRTRPRPVDLVFPLSANTKMSFIIQKATELAVSNLYPIQTEFGQKQLHSHNKQSRLRYQKIIIAAAMQSGLNVLPCCHTPCQVQDLPWSIWAQSTKVVCHPGSQSTNSHDHPDRVIWFVGPEGGWSDAEISFFEEKKCDFRILAPTLLRMETACVAALSQQV